MKALRRRRAGRAADGSMTLMEHLYELRHRVFLAVLAVFLGAMVGFIWFSIGIPSLHIRPLIEILTRPYCEVPSPPRVEFEGVSGCQLLANGPFSPLQVRLTSAVLAGAVLSCPVWLYHVWAYVGPALYSKEKKFALTFTGVGAVLFAGGMVLAYFVMPEALKVLLGFGGSSIQSALDPQLYFKFLVGMMLIFGVSLELPLLLVMLNYAGVLTGVKLAKVRRYAFFGMVVFAGIAVPGNDPVSMGVLALTLCILYEAAVQVTKAHDRRRGKVAATAAFAELSDDVASPLSLSPEAEDAADRQASGDIGLPEPIAASPAEFAGESPAPSGPIDEPESGPTSWTDVT